MVLVQTNSNHNLAKYVEDDEQLFVIWNGGWCLAEDFFAMKDISKFKGEDIEYF